MPAMRNVQGLNGFDIAFEEAVMLPAWRGAHWRRDPA